MRNWSLNNLIARRRPHSRKVFASTKRLRFEELESRRVLSAVIPFSELTVTESWHEGSFDADQAFNGIGLTGNQHDNQVSSTWLAGNFGAAFDVTKQWLKIDLGGARSLDFLRVWNANFLTNLGIKTADIYVANSDPGNNVGNNIATAFDPTGWTRIEDDYEFVRASGTGSISPTDEIQLGGVQASFLAIKVEATHDNPVAVGLSEMQIFASDPNGTTTHTLTVNGGDGDGDYLPGAPVSIQADPAPTNQIFSGWTGADASRFGDILNPNTIFTMTSTDQVISATYAPIPSNTQTWQIDFDVTEPTHFTLQSTTATWDAGFGTTWNSYEATMFGHDDGVQRPFHTGYAVNNLLDSTGGASVADFEITDGKMYGIVNGYNQYPNFNNLSGDIQGMSAEHIFWGDDLPLAPNLGTTHSISMEFSDLTAGTYSLAVYSASHWHTPHRGMRIQVDGQTQDLTPGASGQSYQFAPAQSNIRSYLDENIKATFNNLNVDASGVLSIDMSEIDIPGASLDPSLAGLILTRVAGVPVVDNADFNDDGDVDGFDFLTWQRGFGTDAGSGQAAPQNEGNANGDPFVNADDLTIWQDQYGQNSSSTSALTTTTTTVATPTSVEPSEPLSTPIASSSVSSLAALNALITAKDEALANAENSFEDREEVEEVSLDAALQTHDLTALYVDSFRKSLESATDSEEANSATSDELFEQLGIQLEEENPFAI